VDDVIKFIDLAFSLGKMYTERFLGKETKGDVEEMAKNILTSYDDIFDETSWMEDETKKASKKKAKSLRFGIAYPQAIMNDKDIKDYIVEFEVGKGFLETMNNRESKISQRRFERVYKPVSDVERFNNLNPLKNDAQYVANFNTIVYSGGRLRHPLYNYNRPRSLNYGLTGFTLGHEIGHGFDANGRMRDENGNFRDWWSEDVVKNFKESTDCMKKIYHDYPLPGPGGKTLNSDGEITLSENIADHAGLRTAYKAFNKWISDEKNSKSEPNLPGLKEFSHQQLFFIAFSQLWCKRQTLESIEAQLKYEAHAVYELRSNIPLSHFKEFSDTFKCPLNSRMNPEKKCAVFGN
jgi:predicted metalloendopeptidase